MFEHDYVTTKHFTRKADSVSSYRQWCFDVGINPEDFPFEVDTGNYYKLKPIIHRVVSWGSFLGADGFYIVFLCYRFNAMKHTVQYSWRAGKDGKISGDVKKFEWIN